ncbi:hypothetical protein ZWY2020_032065 [Hordeum vulgare]|nr:hypothetical protein ZWY2020_032065 [Hordeum vulgare]
MEEHLKAMAELIVTVAAMAAKIDEIHPAVLDLRGWKPTIEHSVEDIKAEVSDLWAMLRDKGTSAEGTASSASFLRHQQQQPPPPIRLLDLPPIVPHIVDVNLAWPAEGLHVHGGYGHGPISHGRTSDHRVMSPGHQSPRAPPIIDP